MGFVANFIRFPAVHRQPSIVDIPQNTAL